LPDPFFLLWKRGTNTDDPNGAGSQLAKEETKKRGNGEEKKKKNGANGKYPCEAWYNG
jgi:hypothetical protein